MKRGYCYYLLPLVGTVFCLWYIHIATYDVIYSDYVRLVNSYLPDVWNPAKFFVPDVLTRVPASYLGRIVNVAFFGYSLTFDRVLGVLGLGLSGMVFGFYCREKQVGMIWLAFLMVVLFSLNKWEMLTNGSGWAHFVAFAGFYYHYLVFDRIWRGKEKKGDHIRCLLLPFVLTLLFAGPYCAIYSVTVILAGLCLRFRKARYGRQQEWTGRQREQLGRQQVWLSRQRERQGKFKGLGYSLSSLIALLLYMWSNSYAVEDHAAAATGTVWQQLFETPSFFIRMFVKSFSSMAIGMERAEAVFQSNAPFFLLGGLVIAAYVLALWLNWKYRLYEETIFPLLLIVSGGLNHVLITVSRWIFLNENYGGSSRYALQFQAGILGILLTIALVWKKMGTGCHKVLRFAAGAVCVLFLAGNCYTSYHELLTAPYRKERFEERAALALDFENRTDEELRLGFEYRTNRPDSGQKVRAALTILKENHYNVFRD